MDDARARGPEAYSELCRRRLQEIVDFLVLGLCGRKVFTHAHVGTNEVVAMHCGWHGDMTLASVHELQERHLRRGVLHGHAVGTEIHIRLATTQSQRRGIIKQM